MTDTDRSITRIPDYEHMFATIDGDIISTRSGKPYILRQTLRRDGNYQVVLTCKRKGRTAQKCLTVAAAVLSAFVGPRPKGHVAIHLDSDRANNRPSNLKWVSNSACRKFWARAAFGEQHHRAKLNDATVLEMYRQRAAGASIGSLSQQLDLSLSTVSSVLRGDSWKHLWQQRPEAMKVAA